MLVFLAQWLRAHGIRELEEALGAQWLLTPSLYTLGSTDALFRRRCALPRDHRAAGTAFGDYSCRTATRWRPAARFFRYSTYEF
jgi:hypothetical protein